MRRMQSVLAALSVVTVTFAASTVPYCAAEARGIGSGGARMIAPKGSNVTSPMRPLSGRNQPPDF